MQNRVAERLRRLRERFGEGVREREVDHDHDRLTGTRTRHVPLRTFFLGEIWWAERFALGDRRPYREGSSHVPALVTLREERPCEPVELAPSGHCPRLEEDDGCFQPRTPPSELRSETVFLLLYRRPVGRESLSSLLGALGGQDKQRLAAALETERRSERGVISGTSQSSPRP